MDGGLFRSPGDSSVGWQSRLATEDVKGLGQLLHRGPDVAPVHAERPGRDGHAQRVVPRAPGPGSPERRLLPARHKIDHGSNKEDSQGVAARPSTLARIRALRLSAVTT